MKFCIACAAAAALVAAAPSASAITIAVGGYTLGNHPDGSAQPPRYGLRLDELYNATSGSDIFTFDFEHPDSGVFMMYTGSTVHIYGQAYGGRDTGAGYAADAYQGIYTFDFTYAVGVQLAPGDDDVIANAQTADNSGFITTPLGDMINLWDKRDGGYTFRLGDEDSDAGHRGWGGISGWGWINHGSPTTHYPASDWLFTAQPGIVPAPASLALLGVGGLAAARRRR